MTIKFRNYHTIRHVLQHVQALDDLMYGSPDSSYKEDRALANPEQYLNELKHELKIVQGVKEDVLYVIKEFNNNTKIPQTDIPLEIDAKNYVFHYLQSML